MASDHDVTAIAARVRAALATGATLHEVLQALRGHPTLPSSDICRVLIAIAPMDLQCAQRLVDSALQGRRLRELGLADLELLADAPRAEVSILTRLGREDAIIDRTPYLLACPHEGTAARFWLMAAPDAPSFEAMSVGIFGHGSSFETVREQLRADAAAWPSELRMVRDEPERILMHFLRVRAPRPASAI